MHTEVPPCVHGFFSSLAGTRQWLGGGLIRSRERSLGARYQPCFAGVQRALHPMRCALRARVADAGNRGARCGQLTSGIRSRAGWRAIDSLENKNTAAFLRRGGNTRGTTLDFSLHSRRITAPAVLPYLSGKNAPGPCSPLASRRFSPAAALFSRNPSGTLPFVAYAFIIQVFRAMSTRFLHGYRTARSEPTGDWVEHFARFSSLTLMGSFTKAPCYICMLGYITIFVLRLRCNAKFYHQISK